jgi:regulator of protease activity HflC (stomatin/prohibitin superfamily)
MEALIGLAVFVVLVVVIMLGRSIKQIQQYEEGIVFRFGRVLAETRPPGLTFIRPIGDRVQKVNKQIVAMAVPAQEGITKDNISVRVDAVVYFKVVDPIKATINVQNYMFAVSQRAQTSLRSIIGQSEMDELLSERDRVNRQLCRVIDDVTEMPWGVKVESVEIKDVSLPEGMKRSIARQAEAERERRARIIVADAEYQASKRLAAAANVMARDPAALQLRLLQTVVEVASEKNSTLVMPVPVELLRFFERAAGGHERADAMPTEMPEDTGDAEVAAAEAAIEHEAVAPSIEAPMAPAAPALGSDDSLAIPPVPEIPEARIPDAEIPEVAVPAPPPRSA